MTINEAAKKRHFGIRNVSSLTRETQRIGTIALLVTGTSFLAAQQAHGQAVEGACDAYPAAVVQVGEIYGSGNSVCLKAWGSIGQFQLGNRSFLARENATTNVLELGVVQTRQSLSFSGYGFQFEMVQPGSLGYGDSFSLGDSFGLGINETALTVGYASTRAQGSYQRDIFDVGAGYGLGIPGMGGGPTGVFLPYGTPNTLTDLQFSSGLEWRLGEVNLEARNRTETTTTRFEFGILHSLLDQTETFSANIPGYSSGFNYQFDFDSRATGLHFGARHEWNMSPLANGWTPRFGVRGRVGVAHVQVNMYSHSSFSGYIGTMVNPSSNSDTNTSTAPYFGAGASFSLNSPDRRSQFFVDAAAERRPWGVGAILDGTNPSRVERQDMFVSTLSVGYRLRF